MQTHQIRPAHKGKKSKRIARGGKRGTTSGRGAKGQKSRSGSGGKNIVEKGRSSWIKRFPKLGGFISTRLANIVVSSSALEEKFDNGATISMESLKKAGLVTSVKRGKAGKRQLVKILNDGQITKKFIVEDCLASKQVKEMIEKAGGKFTTNPSMAEKSQKAEKTKK